MAAVPGATAVTVPSAATNATVGSLLFQRGVLRLAFVGDSAAVSFFAAPVRISAPAGSATLVTGVITLILSSLTCGSAVADLAVAAMVALPALTPLTRPVALTEAALAFVELKVTVYPSGTPAPSCSVPFTGTSYPPS